MGTQRGKRKIASIMYLVHRCCVESRYRSCGFIRWISCIILCSNLFGKVSQRRATLATTEALLLRRASCLRYNEPRRPFHRGRCWLYVVNEKGIQHYTQFLSGSWLTQNINYSRINLPVQLLQLARQLFRTSTWKFQLLRSMYEKYHKTCY